MEAPNYIRLNKTYLCFKSNLFYLLQEMRRKYQEECDILIPVTFGGDHIALDIPDDGVQTHNGWEIVPLQKPAVSASNIHVCTLLKLTVHDSA